MSTQHVQYVLLFLVLPVNSDRFHTELHALTPAARSFALLLLARIIYRIDTLFALTNKVHERERESNPGVGVP